MKSWRTLHILASGFARASPRKTGRIPATFLRTTAPGRYIFSSGSRVPLSVKIRNYTAQARHDNPIGFPLLVFATAASVTVLGLLAYDEYFSQPPTFAAYPAEVEQQLRLALHYTYVKPNKNAALERFQTAIRLADEYHMDQFEKPYIGLQIRYAQMLETFGLVKQSVDTLDELTQHFEKKLDDIKDVKQDDATKELRKRLLKGIIQNRVKMSSLYESDYLQDMNMAKATLSEAVALLVKETQDPQTRGFTDNNAADMSLEEIAAMLSQMGDLYAVSGEEDNAVQVYMLTLQPLRAACNGTRSCREAQVLSNIASTMDLAMKKPNAKINGQVATKASLAAARQGTLKWADAALNTVKAVPQAEQDSTCIMAQISAMLTKSDLMLDMGEKTQAKEQLTTLIPVLTQMGLKQLIPQAEAALARAES